MHTVDLPRLMTIPEVADLLAISSTTVRRMTAKGSLRGIRIQGQWRYSPDAIASMLDDA